MKEAFTDRLNLRVRNMALLSTANDIIEVYLAEGLKLTLRQLFYVLVSRDIIENTRNEYDNLGEIITKGRKAGVVDWDGIEDRIRVPYRPYHTDSVLGGLNTMHKIYRLDRQEGQNLYIEVWCEKDALSGVIRRITQRYHVYLMVNRGYTSTTAIYDAALRFIEAENERNQSGILLYIGDHDPSGLDMIRDINERLRYFGARVEVIHVALTAEQIREYDPPPNYAKVRDPRAKEYIRHFGRRSWEVDALEPKVLNEIVERAVMRDMDLKKFRSILRREKRHRARLLEIIRDEEKRKK